MEPTSSIQNEVAAAVIADKCRSDQDFAYRMQADCKAALSSLSGVSLADDLNVSVVRNTPERVHIMLPDYACRKDRQQSLLTDEQMAEIAGGEIFIAALTLIVAGTLGTLAVTGIAVGLAIDE